MAYDMALAARVRKILARVDGVSERKMFGGLCFMIHGNMAVGLTSDDLMIRVGQESYEAMLARPHARPMDFTGKPMKGFIYVGAGGTSADADLKQWVLAGVDFAGALPPRA